MPCLWAGLVLWGQDLGCMSPGAPTACSEILGPSVRCFHSVPALGELRVLPLFPESSRRRGGVCPSEICFFGVVGRGRAPQRHQHFNPWNLWLWELHGAGVFEDVIKVKTLLWKDYPGLSRRLNVIPWVLKGRDSFLALAEEAITREEWSNAELLLGKWKKGTLGQGIWVGSRSCKSRVCSFLELRERAPTSTFILCHISGPLVCKAITVLY